MTRDEEQADREWAGELDHIDEPRPDPGRCDRPSLVPGFRRTRCRGPIVAGSCTACGRPARRLPDV
jgi:hypothetical protein